MFLQSCISWLCSTACRAPFSPGDTKQSDRCFTKQQPTPGAACRACAAPGAFAESKSCRRHGAPAAAWLLAAYGRCSMLPASSGRRGISHLPTTLGRLGLIDGCIRCVFFAQLQTETPAAWLCLAGTVIGQRAVRTHRHKKDSIG